MENILELRHVYKTYGTVVKKQALTDISLTFEKGSFTSIIGQSGSGKSTLLNIMGTLDTPTQGHVILQGTDTSSLSRDRLAEIRNRTLGFVFQFHYLLPEFSALENVLLPYRIGGRREDRQALERAKGLLSMVGLAEVMHNNATALSGGQQQRAAIARALINRPPILLADEPTGNLDSESASGIYDLFRQINQQLHTTFILITHDNRIAEKADRIVEIRDGKLAAK